MEKLGVYLYVRWVLYIFYKYCFFVHVSRMMPIKCSYYIRILENFWFQEKLVFVPPLDSKGLSIYTIGALLQLCEKILLHNMLTYIVCERLGSSTLA